MGPWGPSVCPGQEWEGWGRRGHPISQRGLPHRHCHDLHDGLVEALAEADQGGPAVTHTAQHDACGGRGNMSISLTAQAKAWHM